MIYEQPINQEVFNNQVFLEYYRNGNPRDSYYISLPTNEHYIIKRNAFYDVYFNGVIVVAAMSLRLIKHYFGVKP